MPQRKIKILPPIEIKDPLTGVSAGELTFQQFMERVYNHPLWNEGIKAAKAQLAIRNALSTAIAEGKHDVVIAEEDWAFAHRAVEQPKTSLADGSTVAGLGFIPSAAAIVLPYMLAIAEAEQV